MSSTNRGGSRHASDYYATPVSDIKVFLDAYHARYGRLPGPILDPCAGGSDGVAMSYPVALEAEGYGGIHTLDIRPDSPAAEIGDYREREREMGHHHHKPALLYRSGDRRESIGRRRRGNHAPATQLARQPQAPEVLGGAHA